MRLEYFGFWEQIGMLTVILHKGMSGISETVTATDFGLGKCVGNFKTTVPIGQIIFNYCATLLKCFEAFFLHYVDQDKAIHTSRETLLIELVYK